MHFHDLRQTGNVLTAGTGQPRASCLMSQFQLGAREVTGSRGDGGALAGRGPDLEPAAECGEPVAGLPPSVADHPAGNSGTRRRMCRLARRPIAPPWSRMSATIFRRPGWSAAGLIGAVMALTVHMIAGNRARATSAQSTHSTITNQTSPHDAETVPGA